MAGAGVVVGAALAAGAIAPWPSRDAEAQVDPSQPVTDPAPGQVDPALVGTDPALGGTDPALAASEPALAAPATPVVTPEASIPSPTWEPTDAGMATSLGGSDIAVASEGGSHQVDAPKRKANKILGEKKRP
ncbi:MAG: hypothetical protein M3Z20_06965 [Chloroflexota bacterium]|nr:hypothetical protein [Chloroflexota bacterium]